MNANAQAIQSFIANAKPSEEFRETMAVFLKLYETVNDPTTREAAAPRKARLVYDLAEKQLGNKKNVDIKIITATDPITQTVTHNTIVTFGDPNTGANTVLYVHTDTIFSKNHTLRSEGNRLIGEVEQDDTIHLAAIITSLDDIQIPEKGAIIIAFTDYEENGCRGSSAILKTLLEKIPAQYPLACIALESTDRALAIGHRGKFSSEISGKTLDGPITSTALAFIQQLSRVQYLAHTGTSTYGTVNPQTIWARLDFRTNDIATTNQVEEHWSSPISSFDETDVIDQAQKRLEQNLYTISKTNGEIQITSKSTKLHPAELDPTHDETILPFLYLLLKTLKRLDLAESIQEINWGQKDRQNSNPIAATIKGSWNTLNIATLTDQMAKIVPEVIAIETPTFSLNQSKTDKTDYVASPKDQAVANITRELSDIVGEPVPNVTMNYMTDIGRIFNAAKARGQKVYGFVFGVGKTKNMHGIEEISIQDCSYLITALKRLPNIIQKNISASNP